MRRCKKHLTDHSSSLGVCASCLRERLLFLLRLQQQLRKSHQPLFFPRSVSPYVTRLKFDGSHACSKKKLRFSQLSNLFGSRSDKASDTRISFRDSCEASSSSPSSWMSPIFSSHTRKQPMVCYMEDIIANHRGRRRMSDRGMSPAMGSESEEECEPAIRKRTPVTGPGSALRRAGAGHLRNISWFAICLSPLLRGGPRRDWSQKGAKPSKKAYSGDIRSAIKPHLATVASFSANRSRKLADFGRANW